MRSILHNKTPAATPRTHPQLPTHLCTQPTPTVTYTLLCSHAHSLHPQLPIHFYAAMHTAYTHSYLYTFMQPCTQPTSTVTYTLLCSHAHSLHPQLPIHFYAAKIVDSVATFGTCGWLLVSNKCLLVSFILPGFAFFFKKKKCCLPHIVVKIKCKDI